MAPKTFARRVETLRDERGWSQNQLAARAGMRAADLSRILTGTRNLLSHHVARLAAALDVTVDELVGRTGIEVDLTEGVPQEVLVESERARREVEKQLDAYRALAGDVLGDLEKAHGLLGESAGKEPSARLAKLLAQLGKVVKSAEKSSARASKPAAKLARPAKPAARPAAKPAATPARAGATAAKGRASKPAR